MVEIWKPIPGYEGYYEASSCGRIRSVERECDGRWGKRIVKQHILKQNMLHDGYKQVKFCIDRMKSQPLVHRLIAQTCIPNPQNLPQVNHKDGNTENNCPDNLEWCTAAFNSQHRSRVLKKWVGHPKKKVLCLDTGVVYESSHHASRDLGISQGGIFSVCQGRCQKAKGLRFAFVDI